MKDPKFRVWDKLTSKMSPSFSLFGEFTLIGGVHAWQHEESFALGIHDHFDSLGRLNDLEIMQFTDLHDKNGKEIFENDTISFTINFSDEDMRAYWSRDGFTGVVTWDKFGWAINRVVFQKMFDSDYVFSMQNRSFDKDLLNRYSKIKSISLDHVSNIEVTGFYIFNKELL